jgi:hypothetical protein
MLSDANSINLPITTYSFTTLKENKNNQPLKDERINYPLLRRKQILLILKINQLYQTKTYYDLNLIRFGAELLLNRNFIY